MARKPDGKVALNTGAGSGIGRATAELFAAEGVAGRPPEYPTVINDAGIVSVPVFRAPFSEHTLLAARQSCRSPNVDSHMARKPLDACPFERGARSGSRPSLSRQQHVAAAHVQSIAWSAVSQVKNAHNW
jgi:hypothetical protein